MVIVAPKYFYNGILHRNYRKMTMYGHFPIIPLENCPYITQFHFLHDSLLWTV